MKTFTITISLLTLLAGSALAQDNPGAENTEQQPQSTSGDTKFLLTGYGFAGFTLQGDNANFGETGFAPIFLWKASKNVFFEAELEFELEEELEIMLEYADINFILNKYMTLRAGKFLTPFGIFQERLHPAWINKFAGKPPGFGHDALTPGSEIGIEIRGGVPLGVSKLNYSVYASNGPALNTSGGHGSAPTAAATAEEESGMLQFGKFIDNNLNKAIGGRIGLLPFSNSALELGFSFQQAKPGSDNTYMHALADSTMHEQNYKDIGAQMWALDLSFTKGVALLKGIIDVRAQLNNTTVDNVMYYIDADSAMYSFDNVNQSYYAQLAFRPGMLKNKFLKNLELTGRYAALAMAEGAKWSEEESQMTFGLNYWASWRSVMKFNVQVSDVNETAFLFQFATGF